MKFDQAVIPGALQAIKYAERLLQGLTVPPIAQVKLSERPVVGGVPVAINHPTFTLGHLAIYPALMAELLHVPSKVVEVPENYPTLFKIGTPCVDDPEGSVYPALSELAEHFFKGMHYIIGVLPTISEEVLAEPLQDQGRRERFGSVGPFVAYLLTAHPMTHLGQLSAWRRCVGLPAV